MDLSFQKEKQFVNPLHGYNNSQDTGEFRRPVEKKGDQALFENFWLLFSPPRIYIPKAK